MSINANIIFYLLMVLSCFKMLDSIINRGSLNKRIFTESALKIFTNIFSTLNTLWRRRKECGWYEESLVLETALDLEFWKLGQYALVMRKI